MFPDLNIDVASVPLQFDDLVYKSQDIYQALTDSSTPKPEFVGIKPNLNVLLAKISIPQFNGQIDQ